MVEPGRGFDRFDFGGDGGNRTRVRKRVARAFYGRSFCFKSPAARRSKASSGLWQPFGSWQGSKAVPSLTFTAHRRSYPGRGAPGKNGCLFKQQQQQSRCRLILKFAGFRAVLRRCPLTKGLLPRRNLYIPVSFWESAVLAAVRLSLVYTKRGAIARLFFFGECPKKRLKRRI